MSEFHPTNIDYTSCFCEENVYKLAQKACQSGYDEGNVFVVFVSSDSKCTPIWYQKSSNSIDEPVLWDYHVILMIKRGPNDVNSCGTTVYDLDSLLPFPCPFDLYFEKCFRPNIQFKSEHMQKFRVIPASKFLEIFASDRSHMATSGKPFPSWPLIRGSAAGCDMNLNSFINVTQSSSKNFGVVLTKEMFKRWATS